MKLFFALFIVVLSLTTNVFADEYVVLVNEKNPIKEFTAAEVSQILLANKTDWQDGKRIFLINYDYESIYAENIFKNYAGMSGLQAKKNYLTKVFNGVLQKQPLTYESLDEIIDRVSENPQAIAVVVMPSKVSNSKIKVLKIH